MCCRRQTHRCMEMQPGARGEELVLMDPAMVEAERLAKIEYTRHCQRKAKRAMVRSMAENSLARERAAREAQHRELRRLRAKAHDATEKTRRHQARLDAAMKRSEAALAAMVGPARREQEARLARKSRRNARALDRRMRKEERALRRYQEAARTWALQGEFGDAIRFERGLAPHEPLPEDAVLDFMRTPQPARAQRGAALLNARERVRAGADTPHPPPPIPKHTLQTDTDLELDRIAALLHQELDAAEANPTKRARAAEAVEQLLRAAKRVRQGKWQEGCGPSSTPQRSHPEEDGDEGKDGGAPGGGHQQAPGVWRAAATLERQPSSSSSHSISNSSSSSSSSGSISNSNRSSSSSSSNLNHKRLSLYHSDPGLMHPVGKIGLPSQV
eukprot:jgi/Mesvir1/15250/Mv26316-RA.1